jgi:hypothetical protein
LFVTLSLTAFLSVVILNVGTAFSQNADVSYLDVNSSSSSQLSKFSVAAWFKTSADYNTDAFIVNKAGASDNLNYGIWMTNAEKIRGGFESASGIAFYATSPLSYSDGKWHYAVVTFDGSAIGLYVDGLLVATKTASASPDSGGDEPIRMGANSQGLNDYFVGNVDEIRIWKIALTPQQVIDASNGKFNSNDQIEYLDFSEPIVPLNNTAPVNATLTNQTGFQDINGTLTNNTSSLSTTVLSNETNLSNGTDNNVKPIEVPQPVNNTLLKNDTGAQNQTQTPPPEENNSPEASAQSISVDQYDQVKITMTAKDKDNDPLRFDITADPLHGSLVDFDKEKGTVTYVPQNNYFGEDKFTFKAIDDNDAESNGADVKINVKQTAQSDQSQVNNESKVLESVSNTTETNTNLIQQQNQPPKADAGDDQKVEINTQVKLDGSKSSDEDGKIASYKWEQTDGPQVDVKKADEQVASFDVPESAADSKLVFKLTVVDDKGDSASDDVTIVVQNTQTDNTQAQNTQTDNTQAQNIQANVPPKADAGDDQKVQVNTQVKLDGSKSSDDDGKIASYKWEQTDGEQVDLKKADKQVSSFDVPESAADSKLVFKLTVVDDKGDSADDEIEIQVQKIS